MELAKDVTVLDAYAQQVKDLLRCLEHQLINLNAPFIKKYFPDIEQYYFEKTCVPILVMEAGYSAECVLSNKQTCHMIDKIIKDELSKKDEPSKKYSLNVVPHLYIMDIEYLIDSVQNLLLGMEEDWNQFNRNVSQAFAMKELQDGAMIFRGRQSIDAATYAGNFFIKAGSILDLITKIAWELEHEKCSTDKYSVLSSSKIMWGDAKDLLIVKEGPKDVLQNTLLEKVEVVQRVITFRNEVVHNGCWEKDPKIYIKFEKGSIVDEFMLAPDIENGHLAKFKNRNHFYSQEKRVGDLLIETFIEFMRKLSYTIVYMCNPTESVEQLERRFNAVIPG